LLLPLFALVIHGFTGAAHATPLPAPWQLKDIGKPVAPAVVDVDPRGIWSVRAENGAVGTEASKTDNFCFIYRTLSGDGSITVLLMGQQGGHPEWGKAGLMIRENDSAGARNVLLAMTTGHGLQIAYRPRARKATVDEGDDGLYGARRFPAWLRLQREGDRFTPFGSTDGFGWTQLHAPITLPRFAKDGLVGLAACSALAEPTALFASAPVVVPGQVSPLVQACAGNGAVLLTWPPVANATGYRVRRSAPETLGFAADLLTPEPIRETSFQETALPSGQSLRYLVSAVFGQGEEQEEGWATSVVATPFYTPASLFGCDINLETTQTHGAIRLDPENGFYRISGAGGDLPSTEDHCFFASRWVTGDVQITARIVDRPSRTRARSGLMIRESLEGPSRMLFLAGTGEDGVLLQQRKKTGGAASPGATAIEARRFQPPLYLRLVRRGSIITPLASLDGLKFFAAGKPQRFTPPLAESLYVGYAITSQRVGVTASNWVSHLTIEPLSGP
jgi:hypothetical protein